MSQKSFNPQKNLSIPKNLINPKKISQILKNIIIPNKSLNPINPQEKSKNLSISYTFFSSDSTLGTDEIRKNSAVPGASCLHYVWRKDAVLSLKRNERQRDDCAREFEKYHSAWTIKFRKFCLIYVYAAGSKHRFRLQVTRYRPRLQVESK